MTSAKTNSSTSPATPSASPAADGMDLPSGWHGHVSLRVKGVVSLVAFVAYLAIVGVLITAERERLLGLVQQLEAVHQQESQLVQINMMVARAVLSANERHFFALPDLAIRQLNADLFPLERILGGLARSNPDLREHFGSLQGLLRDLRTEPTSETVTAVRHELHGLVLDLERMTQALRADKDRLMLSYRQTHDRVTLETLSFALLGVVVFGALVTIFFTRLAWDLRRVAARAVEVVKGYRGAPLEVTRGDDVGGLMVAINDMQSELRNRERQLEIVRQQQFHHEKMAAVGSLAAAVAHEISNPIMAIAGIAQAISENQKLAKTCGNCNSACQPELILEQTRRISQITRHIAEFSAPQSVELQVLDLNAIVSSTCNLIRFDSRFRRIAFDVHLDPQLPAVWAVADHLSQVFINLLINAADALENVVDREPRVCVTSRDERGVAEVVVEDNGSGMEAGVLRRAFDEYFTTKGPGRGSGLGLFLCRSLLESMGASIELESAVDAGTKVIIRLQVADEA